MDSTDVLNQKYCQKLETIDRNIDLALSEVATCIKSFLPNEQPKKKDRRAVKEVKELVPFIESILQFFHRYPNDNFEELLLPHVGEIRQQNSLPLIDEEQLNPCKNCEWEENQSSISHEENENDSQKLAWNMLCWHLEKYIQKQLSIQFECLISDPKMGCCIWQYYIQKLSNILSPDRLWEFHIHLRAYQLSFYKCPCFGSHSNLYCLNCLVFICINNFSEDTKFLTTGSFGQLVVTRDDLYILYARKISSFVTIIFNNIEEYNKSPLATGLIRQMKCFHVPSSSCKVSLKLYNTCKTYIESTYDQKFPEIILLKVIELLYIFEQKTLGLSNSVSQSYLNLNDLIMSLPSDSPEQSPIHQPSPAFNSDKKENNMWNWRSVLVEKGFLNLLQRRLHNTVSESVMEACAKEWKIFRETKNPGKIEIVMEDHYSYRVMNSAVITVTLLDTYKPLLAASYGALFPFCASFCHVIHTYLVDLIDHLKKVSENAAIDCCYLSLYTCVYLIEKLSVYSNFCSCGSNGESQLQLLIRTVESQLIEWIDLLKLRIITHHLKGILCGILQDSDSNNWEESKSFFENERISHCLTIWNVYVKRLLNDMKQCLPPEITYQLFGRILKDSVNHLTARYSNVKPSESRTVQLRTDITFLLYCVSEFLPHICSSLNEYLGLTDHYNKILKPNNTVKEIHSNCCSLLMVLAIVTSPLGALCKIYKNGFPQLAKETDNMQGGKSNWLTWVHPILFRKSKDGYLISSTNVWLTTKISLCQNSTIPSLVLTAITLHTCTLSILLMTQASKLPKEMDTLKFDLAIAILNVLKFSRHKPHDLGLVMIPVINSCEDWEIFDGHLVITSSNAKKPWWYSALVETMQGYLKDSICSSLTTILRLATVLDSAMITEWKTIYLHLRQVVRCTCNETQVIDRETAIYQLSLKLLHSLVEAISAIPQTILLCMIQLQEHLTESNLEINPVQGNIGLQILLDIAYNDLKSESFLEECLGQKPSQEMKQMCHDVANCLVSLSIPDGKFKDQNVPLWCLNESKLFLSQIESIFQVKMEKPNYPDDIDNEENVNNMLINVLRDSKGPRSIKYLHKIMVNNATWIQNSLGIPGFLSSDLVVSSVCPSPLPPLFKNKGEDSESLCIPEEESYKENNHGNRATPPFKQQDNHNNLNLDPPKDESKIYDPLNVIEEFNKIGDEPYTYDKIANVKYFWEALLSHLPFMGLTEEGFKGLLVNRWDMNNEKLLSEGEKHGVQILREQYSLDKQKPNLT